MVNSYVMSIKKEYALNLLNGKSMWEYRRRKSKIKTGDKIILYATSPDKELIGEFIVGEVITGNPSEVWEKTKKDICYEIQEVVPYLQSGNYPIAFQVTKPKKYKPSIPISTIPYFKPPMSYCKAPEQLISGML
ncbi:ASCH domain-containing protein [Candidatus Pacearchaeota archaeon]|nr:ASCH domain-containing protein [Candidatus Pacearchaeota archaeon]